MNITRLYDPSAIATGSKPLSNDKTRFKNIWDIKLFR